MRFWTASLAMCLSTCALPALAASSDEASSVTAIHSQCPDLRSDTYYFPANTFVSRSELLNGSDDSLERQWYSSQLRAAHEVSLSCGEVAAAETYRFVWLRTFHHPIMIRISRFNSRVQVTSIVLSGAGGYEPGRILSNQSIAVSSAAWLALADRLATAAFWDADTTPTSTTVVNGKESIVVGADGAEWIFEGRDPVRYHVVKRWSPDGGPFYDLGLTFLKIGGVKVPTNNIY